MSQKLPSVLVSGLDCFCRTVSHCVAEAQCVAQAGLKLLAITSVSEVIGERHHAG